VEHLAHPRPQGTALRDPMVMCLWWLLALDGDAAGTIADIVAWLTSNSAATSDCVCRPRGVVTRCGSGQRGDAGGWATVAYARAAPGERLKQRVAACR